MFYFVLLWDFIVNYSAAITFGSFVCDFIVNFLMPRGNKKVIHT